MPSLRHLAPGRSLAEVEAVLPDLATGLRAATATVLPIALSIGYQRPELSWMALGGWLGTLADPGGTRPVRARRVLAFTVLGAAVTALGETSGPSLVRATALVGGVAFAGTALRPLGASASTMGTLLTIVAAVATGRSPARPLEDVVAFTAGCVLAVLLSSIVWPVWTHLPVRRAVAEVFSALGGYVDAIEGCIARGAAADTDAWAKLGSEHTRRVRDAIEAARAVAVAVRARRPGESQLGSNLRVLLGMAEAQFLSLVTLAADLELADAATRTSARPCLGRVGGAYARVATTLVTRALASREAIPATPAPPTPSALAADLVRESEMALRLACALDQPAPPVVAAEIGVPRHAGVKFAVEWRILRDELTGGSPLLQHAFRVAIAAAAAVLAGHALAPRFAAWVTVTAVVVLQPHAGATVRRAAERVVGTVLGGLVAVAVARLGPSPLALAAIMFPLSVAAMVTRPRSYRWFTFFLTPVFLLVAMRAPGDWWVALERGADTLAGGAIALLASIALWPRWEEQVGLPDAIRAMDDNVRAYAEVVLRSLSRRDDAALTAIAEARLRAAAAMGRAETSLERVLEHPLGDRKIAPETLTVTYGRRLTLAVTALDTLAARRAKGHPEAVEAAAERVRRFESLLAQALGRA